MELSKIREKLMRKGLKYVDMVTLIDVNRAELIDYSENGMILRDPVINEYFLTCEDEEYAQRALEIAKDAREILAHEEFYVNMVMERFKFNEKIPFYHASYQAKTPPEQDAGFDIRVLDTSFVPELARIYVYGGLEYMQERTESGNMFGAFVDGNLAGFIGVHDNGAVGLLRVLDEYKRRGIAVALENYAIAHQIKHNILPYAQIHDGNEASMGLQRKIGMSLADEPVYWMFNENQDAAAD